MWQLPRPRSTGGATHNHGLETSPSQDSRNGNSERKTLGNVTNRYSHLKRRQSLHEEDEGENLLLRNSLTNAAA